jgi:hypothetical protein
MDRMAGGRVKMFFQMSRMVSVRFPWDDLRLRGVSGGSERGQGTHLSRRRTRSLTLYAVKPCVIIKTALVRKLNTCSCVLPRNGNRERRLIFPLPRISLASSLY